MWGLKMKYVTELENEMMEIITEVQTKQKEKIEDNLR